MPKPNHFNSFKSQKELKMAYTNTSVYFLCTFLLCVCHLQHFCSGRDTISTGDKIHDGGDKNIVSASDIFRLYFFTPYGSTKKDHRYVGIWYYSNPEVIVWVANRGMPILINGSVTFGTDIDSGNMKVSDYSNTSTYFSTNLENSLKSQQGRRIAKLHDTGNLVLNDDETGEILRESFNHPTDTLLPGMKMDDNLNLTSWINDQDPAPGNFSF